MIEQQHRQAEAFFESLWKQGDFWQLESCQFEQARYSRLLAIIGGRRYHHVLEIGCGAGAFTKHLVALADRLIALDISPTAVARARAMVTDSKIDFRVQNILDFEQETAGPWDLLVMNETVYYLGWLYPFFDIAWLARRLFINTQPAGRLLLANTQCGMNEPLMLPWVIRAYRDLFLNAGYSLETEEVFPGVKNGMSLEVLISLFTRMEPASP